MYCGSGTPLVLQQEQCFCWDAAEGRTNRHTDGIQIVGTLYFTDEQKLPGPRKCCNNESHLLSVLSSYKPPASATHLFSV